MARTQTQRLRKGVWRPAARTAAQETLLIDTHVWIWYLDGAHDRMAPSAVAFLKRAAHGPGLLVSDMSVWEIGTKAAKGKLSLAPTTSAWVERAGRLPGLSFLPVDQASLFASTQLTGNIHGDPVDRLLIASAANLSIALATADQAIIAYAEEHQRLSVCDIRP